MTDQLTDEITERPSDTRETVVRGASGTGWTLVVPRGWTTLSTDPQRRRGQVRRLLDRRFTGVSRDEVARVRHEIATALEEQLGRAAEQGARQVHVQTLPMRGVPVAASLVVTLVENVGDNSFPAALERALGGADGVLQHGPAEAGPFGALRRLRRVRARRPDLPADLPPGTPGTEGEPGWETVVDWIVEVSPTELLVLTFATTTDQVAGPLVMLFDAIADSLRPATDVSARTADHTPPAG